ncbi:MAG: DUF1972 domain-containing protein [Chloroflexota bacterium]
MKIALMGTRGIPASYSGFETCVEQLGQRLVERGHEVVVYCRSHHITYEDDTYKGMKLVKMPTIANKYLDTLVHSFITSVHALFGRFDIACYFIAGNSPVTWIPRLVGTRTILNVDGLDWKREKWPSLAKKYIRFAEYLATKLPNRFITDSEVVQGYYQDTYGVIPPYIPYGSEVQLLPPGENLEKYGLLPQKYILFVGRLVEENCAHHIVDAFKEIDTDYKCVIVGDAAYAEDYIASLKARAEGDDRIVFTGYVFGAGYHELGTNASIFVESSGVGGTHPALTESMGHGNCVVVNDTAENLETIGDSGFSYAGKEGAKSLKPVLEELLNDPDIIKAYQERASKRASEKFSWESVTDAYIEQFESLL